MTRPSSSDDESVSAQESTDRLDPDAYEHEQWLRENVPPHHG
ncbi:hypothetical protein [Mycobacterium sp. 852002-10029_SCH5224772]|nr:hypothetical protein [Mycobacterium sp. 852002-10029_SCH5224772]